MLQRPESTSRSSSTGGVDLRSVRASSEEVDDLGIGDRVKRVEGLDE
jgi:hypothetical protein